MAKKKKETVTAAQAAELLNVSQLTFRSYVSREQAPASIGFDPENGLRIWDRTEIEKWASNRPGRGRWGR